MEVYKFRLQKLLDIRYDKEEESKRLFKEAQIAKENAENKLNSLQESYNKYRKSGASETLLQQKLKNMYLNALGSSIVEAKKELHQKATVLEEKREKLKQRQIERKTVEILKEKQAYAFMKEQKLIEQRNNDEFALYGYIRNIERR